jgi:hypothetical protein
MLSWATKSYLPYQFWNAEQVAYDYELYAIGDRFSEWLISNWADIHANSKRMVFNILPNKAAELKEKGMINLVIVVDNLGWSYTELLSDLFLEQGYFLSQKDPYLAMVPSETEISKKCLLAGAVGYSAIDDKSYKGMIEKGWVPYFGDRAFRYLSDIGSLNGIKAIEANTYVVNYLAIDKALHKSADEIGMPHMDHIKHLLEKLVANVSQFIDRHNLHESIRIHIVSDHGSTCISSNVQNDLDFSFFKANGFEARSHRYVMVKEERFNKLADNLKIDSFFVPSNDFMNLENYLCARRGNRFLPTNSDIYVHGGLLPEEIIVPSLVFESISSSIKDLTVLLKKNEYRYRTETIELEIGNPNGIPVEQVQVTVLNSNVEAESSKIDILNGMKIANLKIKARFKQTVFAEEETNLRIRIKFLARGDIHSFDSTQKILMKKMVEEIKTNIFDD